MDFSDEHSINDTDLHADDGEEPPSIIKGDGLAENKMSSSGTHASTFPIPDALAKKEEVQRTSELDLYAVRSASENAGEKQNCNPGSYFAGQEWGGQEEACAPSSPSSSEGVRGHAKKNKGRHATNGCFVQDFQHIWRKANDSLADDAEETPANENSEEELPLQQHLNSSAVEDMRADGLCMGPQATACQPSESENYHNKVNLPNLSPLNIMAYLKYGQTQRDCDF